MSSVKITNDKLAPDSEWEVWIGLDGEDPEDCPFGFLVGIGPTKQAAIADAIKDLQTAVNDLYDQLEPLAGDRARRA
jgi:hypothetical protein